MCKTLLNLSSRKLGFFEDSRSAAVREIFLTLSSYVIVLALDEKVHEDVVAHGIYIYQAT